MAQFTRNIIVTWTRMRSLDSFAWWLNSFSFFAWGWFHYVVAARTNRIESIAYLGGSNWTTQSILKREFFPSCVLSNRCILGEIIPTYNDISIRSRSWDIIYSVEFLICFLQEYHFGFWSSQGWVSLYVLTWSLWIMRNTLEYLTLCSRWIFSLDKR